MAEFRVDTDKLQQCSMQIQELSRRVSRSSSEVEAVISRLKMDGGVRTSLRQTSQKLYDESVKMQKLGSGLATVASAYRNAEKKIKGERLSAADLIIGIGISDIDLRPFLPSPCPLPPFNIWPFPRLVPPKPRPRFPVTPWRWPRLDPVNPGPVMWPPVPFTIGRTRLIPPNGCVVTPSYPGYIQPIITKPSVWQRGFSYSMPNLDAMRKQTYYASHNVGLTTVGSTTGSWQSGSSSRRSNAVLGRMAI